MSSVSEGLSDLTDDELDIFIQLVQQLFDEPESYAQNRAELISGGDLTEEDLPPEYDPEALSMLLYVLRKEQQSRKKNMMPGQGDTPPMPMAGAAGEMMQPPQGFARGGIAEAARIVAGSGRNGDTMLAHITPREARLLRRNGGSGTINPVTGLREYGPFSFLKKAWNVVWQPVKKVLKSDIGKIVTRIALNIAVPGYGEIIYAGLQTAANGGEFKDIVKNMAISGVTQYLGGQIPGVSSPIQGPLNNLASGLGITSEVGKQALTQGVVNTGMGLVQGQSLKDSATNGLMAAGTVVASDYLKNTFSPKTEPRIFRNEGPAAPIQEGASSNYSNMPERFTGTDATLASAPSPSTGIDIQKSSSIYDLGANTPNNLGLKPTLSTSSPVSNAGVSTQVAPPISPAGSTSFKPVGVGDAFSTIGEGTKQMLTGDFSKGASNIYKGGSDLFFPPSPTPSQVVGSPEYQTLRGQNIGADKAYELTAKQLEPGFARTYGPGAAAAAGAMYLGGAFDQPEGPPSPTANQMRGTPGMDLIKADPSKYLVQGLPGVQYDANGNIIGSQGPYNRFTMPDVAVRSSYPQYADGGEVGHYASGGDVQRFGLGGVATGTATADPNAALDPNARLILGGVDMTDFFKDALAKANNRTNTSYKATPDKYTTNLQPYASFRQEDINVAPRTYVAPPNYAPSTAAPTYKQFTKEDIVVPSKGIASLNAGGYPRKTGQISGPGTEKSDSIPAMLSDGEFVMTAKAVRGLGKGSRREGAKRMYALMHQLERNAARG
jgi:hypothetical protein